MSALPLRHYDEFKQALENYHISQEGQRILKDLELVAMLAPSSAGRNTIVKELLKTGEYHYIVSDTTRKPRINDGMLEQSGVEYWFRSEEEVLADIRAGKYLEAEVIHHQQVSGISIRELKKAKVQHKTAIRDVDIEGIHNIVQAKPDTIAIMILPPNFKEWQRRFMNRGEIHPTEHLRRVQTASRIFASGLERDYLIFVINEEVTKAAQKINKIVKTGVVDQEEQERAQKLAKQLHEDTEKFLETNRPNL